jgi:hypothetical protein
MHTHLLNYKSADPLSRRLGLNKLDLCMMVMSELEDKYTSASIFRGVFLEAMRQLYPECSEPTALPAPETTDSKPATQNVAPPQLDYTLSPMSDDIVSALMEGISAPNFWETINFV